MRLARLLGDAQMVLWKPPYLVKNYVAEGSAAVEELRRRVRDGDGGRIQKTYNFYPLWGLFAEGREGHDPMLSKYLHIQ
jgi:hypothetical protein